MKAPQIEVKGTYSHLDLQTVSIRIDDLQFKPKLCDPQDLRDLRDSFESAVFDINCLLERVQ